MLVTVTGGTGFLGSFLVRDLLAKADKVCVLARPSPRASKLASHGVRVVHGDLDDVASLTRAVEGAELVYHLAAKVGSAARDAYFQTNVRGTERLLEACAAKRVSQLIYASSLAVYGPTNRDERIDENSPLDEHPRLRDPYSESKIAADKLVSAFAQRTGLPTLIVREGIIYGPGRPLPAGIFATRIGSTDFVFGNASNHFPLNYVENIVDAMQVAAASGSGFRQFNVLDDDNLTLDRYHQLKRALTRCSTRFLNGWPLYAASPFAEMLRPVVPMGDTRLSPHQLKRALQDRFYDTQRIRRETGWRPCISLEEAMRRTLAGLRPFDL